MKRDVIIVGAGIVGLASALKILSKKPGAKILILEKEQKVATHQTGHNSGVIHSGLYYKPGSLKAKNCIEGYRQLVEFCQAEQIKHEICGKVVVATSKEQLPTLDVLFDRGRENGLDGLIKLDSKEALQAYEPHVNGIAGIFVPQTGIVDYKEVAEAYARKIKDLGGEIVFGRKVISIDANRNWSYKEVIVKTDHEEYQSDILVNCAGLFSDRVAQLTNMSPNLRIIPFRGEYYKIKPEKHHLVKNLIYPVPDPNFPFLGVHFTRMIHGGIEAGPNAVLAYAREGYSKSDINFTEFLQSISWPGFLKVASKYWKTGLGEFHRSYSKKAFTKALQELLPEISEDDLMDGGAGVRAQACDKNGGLLDDFMIMESENVINVCNAPSPAATASLSIGDHISEKVLTRKIFA